MKTGGSMSKFNTTTSLDFLTEFAKLNIPIRNKAQIALKTMVQNPFADNIQWEKLKRTEKDLYSTRVDDDYRIIWKHVKPNEIIVCLIDKHDEAYMRARRLRTIKGPAGIKIVDLFEADVKTTDEVMPLFTSPISKDAKVGTVFQNYSDEEILNCGVPQDLIPKLRTYTQVEQVEELETLLDRQSYNTLLEILLDITDHVVLPDQVIVESLEKHHGGENLYRFENNEEFERVLQGDLEEWLLFLKPDQKVIADGEYNGPFRLKGVAGSGKTVVALHRTCFLARHAAEENKKVLFLTFGNRLPKVMEFLIKRKLGPKSPLLKHIECRTFHSWCGSFLRKNGIVPIIGERERKRILLDSINNVRRRKGLSPSLEKRGFSFFEEEIKYVIKGKGLNSLESYLTLERSGRGTRLSANDRETVWQIYETYQSGMQENNKNDYEDLVLLALKIISAGAPLNQYYAVVVDEIQDLSETNMQLVRKLVPQGKNDIFLVGDGLQKIYPGGYTPSKVGIDIVGRSRLLYKNYRNTQEILQAAQTMMDNYKYDDFDEAGETQNTPEYSERSGNLPVLLSFNSLQEEAQWVKGEIERLIVEKDYKLRDFALLFPEKNPFIRTVEQTIGKEYLITELTNDPESYFGDGIKWTTYHSAKGLEFKVVYVMGVTDTLYVPKDDPSLPQDELEDYFAMAKRLLYVAMTRARDLLYLTCSRGQPSRFLNTVPEAFLLRERL